MRGFISLWSPPHGQISLLVSSLAATALGCAGAPNGATTSPASADTDLGTATSVRPGINESYLDATEKDMEDWEERLEGESREVVQSREALLSLLGLDGGEVVADVGAGTGLFAGQLSDLVGDTGRVYAVDIAPQFLAHVRGKMAESGRSNLIFHLAGAKDIGLAPDARLDVAFMCNVYHHIEYPGAYMPTLGAAMKPDGVLWVIDFKRIEGVTDPGILRHVRANQEQVTAEITAAGFVLEESVDLLEENYVLKFRWPAASSVR
jgi:predicted methyltransferase